MSKPGARRKALLPRGVAATAPLGPARCRADRWVQRAAHVLTHEAPREGTAVKRRLHGLLGAMARPRAAAGALAPAVAHCHQVTRSDWPGRFHGDDVAELPRTHNDLEPGGGMPRDHERRATGRPGASPALGLRGARRLVAAAATRLQLVSAWEMAPDNLEAWHILRQALATRRQPRTLRRRFRHDPAAYLAQLEADLLQLSLPP